MVKVSIPLWGGVGSRGQSGKIPASACRFAGVAGQRVPTQGNSMSRTLLLSLILSLLWLLGGPQALAAEADLRAEMVVQLQVWLAASQGEEARGVSLDLLDRRIRVPACDTPYVFSFPFNDGRTLRVECPGLNWSIVTRMNREETLAAPAGAARSSAGVVGGQQAYQLTVAKQAGDLIAEADLQVLEVDPARVSVARGLTLAQLRGAKVARDLAVGSVLQAADVLQAGTALTVTTLVPRGTALSEANTRPATFYGPLPADVITSVESLRRAVATGPLQPGQPLRLSGIRSLADVVRGDEVVVAVRRGPVSIESYAVAEDDGMTGDQITVRSGESGERFNAIVTGVRRVEPL
jgi:flagella basal body P-ring formation protein FlgA